MSREDAVSTLGAGSEAYESLLNLVHRVWLSVTMSHLSPKLFPHLGLICISVSPTTCSPHNYGTASSPVACSLSLARF